MKRNENLPADKDIEVILGVLLRVGVIASMTVVLTGGLIYLVLNHSSLTDYSSFDLRSSKFSSIEAIIRGLLKLDSSAIIQFGLLLLIFTPVMRVVFSIFGFLIERDYLYVLMGSVVLTVILFSLSSGLTG